MFAVRSVEVEGASPALAAEMQCRASLVRRPQPRRLERRRRRATHRRTGGRPQLGRRPGVSAHAPDPRACRSCRSPCSGGARSRGWCRRAGESSQRSRSEPSATSRGSGCRRGRRSRRAPFSPTSPARSRPVRSPRSSAAASRIESPSCARSTVRSRSDCAAARDPARRPDRPAPEDRDRARHPADPRIARPGRAGLSRHHRPRAPGRGPQPSTLRLSLMVVCVDTPVSAGYPAPEKALDSPNALVQLEVEPLSLS